MAATSGNSLPLPGGPYSAPEDARSSPVPVWTAQVLNSGEACWQMVESGQQAMQQRRKRHVQRLFHQGRVLVLKHLPRDVSEHVSVYRCVVVRVRVRPRIPRRLPPCSSRREEDGRGTLTVGTPGAFPSPERNVPRPRRARLSPLSKRRQSQNSPARRVLSKGARKRAPRLSVGLALSSPMSDNAVNLLKFHCPSKRIPQIVRESRGSVAMRLIRFL